MINFYLLLFIIIYSYVLSYIIITEQLHVVYSLLVYLFLICLLFMFSSLFVIRDKVGFERVRECELEKLCLILRSVAQTARSVAR